MEFLSNKLRYESQVQKNGDHIGLLHIVLFILFVTLDQVVSVWNIAWDILEISEVGWVSQDDVIGNTLDSLLWWLNNIQNVRNFLGDDLESVALL